MIDYWIIIDDDRQGPFSLEQMRGMQLQPDTPVWREGLPDWLPASEIAELGITATPPIPVEAPPSVPVMEQTPIVAAPQAPQAPEAAIQAPAAVEQAPAAAVIYAPANAIPPGYVAIMPGEAKCPPTYLVWAIITTIVCFLPLGVCAIICATKVKSHFKAGRIEKAMRMSERAALFVILSIVAWLVWMPFSVVFAMI